MQLLIIAGNVGKDAKLRQTNSDDVLNFSLAVSNGKDKEGNNRPATWYDCSLWGKRAATLEKYIKKGDKLTVSGKPTAREHEGKVYMGITVSDLTFMGRAGDAGEDRQESAKPASSRPSGAHSDLDDEVPFD